MLVYGFEVCALNKSQIASLDFVINRFFMKIFKTNNINIVKACQEYFSFDLHVVLSRRVKNKSSLNSCII